MFVRPAKQRLCARMLRGLQKSGADEEPLSSNGPRSVRVKKLEELKVAATKKKKLTWRAMLTFYDLICSESFDRRSSRAAKLASMRCMLAGRLVCISLSSACDVAICWLVASCCAFKLCAVCR